MRRGSVAVICPFAGTAEEGPQVAARLSRIARTGADKLVMVDNTPSGVLEQIAERDDLRIVHAPEQQSSYHARNVGAAATESEWLLFIDADCVPLEAILDEYFGEPIPEDCGAIAGAIVGVPSQTGVVARWARARGVLDQKRLAHKDRPFGATANLMVRRAALTDVGGFLEGIRSGGDVDLCWRLQDAGWSLLYRDRARVEHVHREHVSALVRQYARYGAGRSWLERRYRGEPRSRRHFALLAAAPALILGNLLVGRKERAAFRFLDAATVIGGLWGRLLDNRPPHPARQPSNAKGAVFVTEFYPEQTAFCAIERLERSGFGVRVEAATRPTRLPASSVRGLDTAYLEDDGALRRLLDLGWLTLRHPRRLARATAGRGASTTYGVQEVSSQVRRIAAQRTSLVYCLRGEPAAVAEARRIGDLLGIRVELLDS